MWQVFALFAAVEGQWATGVIRTCGTVTDSDCTTTTTGIAVPELGITDANGTFCYCTGDLCNSARLVATVGRTSRRRGSGSRGGSRGRGSGRRGSGWSGGWSGEISDDGCMVLSFATSLYLLHGVLALAAARFLSG